jgi:hypothetical protein
MGLLRDAVAATEDEVFKFATDQPQEEEDPNPSDDELDDMDVWESEGLNGAPLPLEEVAYRNLYGDDENGFDRPLQLAEEEQRQEAMLRSNEELISRMAQQQAAHDAQVLEERKRAMVGDVVTYPERVIDHLEQQERQIAQFNSPSGQKEAFVNHSMDRARQRHGDEAFFAAYNQLISLDRNNPEHRAHVQSIYEADDPGAELMGDYRGEPGRSRERAGLRLPSLNSQSRASSHSRSSSGSSGSLSFRDLEKGGNGYSTSGSGEEDDIFNSLW